MRQRTFVCIALSLAAIAATIVLLAASSSSFANFGVNEIRLKQALVSSLGYGHVPLYPSAKLYQAASPAERVAFAKSTVLWTKAYMQSAEFKVEYAKQRENNKPKAPVSKGTPDEQFAQYKLQQQKNLDDFKVKYAKMTPDMQKNLASTLKIMEDNVQKANTDPKTEANMKQMYAGLADAERKGFENRMMQFEKRYPEDPKNLIADRLREFLETSKDVAYDAKLVPAANGKLMRFADRTYEHKSEEWKLCFRAGKEPVEAARAIASAWLQELEKK